MSTPTFPRARTIAVVLAGGTGERMGASVPKQLLRIAGKTVIEHTIAALDSSPEIDEIIVMMEPSHLESIERIRQERTYPKLTSVLPGGTTRNRTTALALQAIEDTDGKVLLHDAVRPFVDERIIAECVAALDEYDAVDTAIPSADTIIQITEGGDGRELIRTVPTRSLLRRGQTPQGFRLSVIREAYRLAASDEFFTATDDCSVVLRYLPDVPIAVVRGADENMKITEPVDISFADKLFQLRTAALRVPDEESRRRALDGATVVVFGGSEGIGRAIGQQAAAYGARTFSFSRTGTGTHIERRAEVAEALATTAAETGRIDYVINTAASLDVKPLAEIGPDEARTSLEVNLLGPVILAQEAHPYLRESRGHLLFFTSSSYTRGRAGYSLYSAAKAGLVNLTQALAEEWIDDGIRVNCINPQRTKTAMRTRAFGDEDEATLLRPEEVAAASIDTLGSRLTGQVVDVRQG